MLPDICPKPSGNLIMLPSQYNYWLGYVFTCVCCSLRSQRKPPIPQDSVGTSCWKQLVQTCSVLLPLRGSAHCSTLQVSHHILASSHSLGLVWHSKKLLLPFEQRNGRSEKRIWCCGAKLKLRKWWQLISNPAISLEILYVWSAW